MLPTTLTTWIRRPLPWLALAFVITALDQATKVAIERTLLQGEILRITHYFNLVLAYNKGAAFSFLANAGGWQKHLFTVIGIAASLFIIFLLIRHGEQKLFSFALALILGGAIGNVIDRVLYGHVIDFLDFHIAGWHWPAFNIADSAIVCGAILLVLEEFLRTRRAKQK